MQENLLSIIHVIITLASDRGYIFIDFIVFSASSSIASQLSTSVLNSVS